MPKHLSSKLLSNPAVLPASTAQLFYAASNTSADLLYLSGIFVPDPFIAFVHQGKSYGIFNALEFNRARKESKLDHILSLEEIIENATSSPKKSASKLSKNSSLSTATILVAQIIIYLASKLKVKSFQIPSTFPAGLAFELQNAGLNLYIGPTPFFSARLCKTPQELNHIREGNKASATGIATAEKILRASIIKKNTLYYQGSILTSDRLRNAINIACLEAGAVAHDTIAAGGQQACDPHCIGSGPLKAHEFIIIDVFPRVTKTGYHGDMTRTFLKGKATDAQKKLIYTVQKAQKLGIAAVQAGVSGASIHEKVSQYFKSQGYLNSERKGQPQGFIHSTGHGLGLDIHEQPTLSSKSSAPLQQGMVVTVEPGLYYPEIGAVRIEDVVCVTQLKPQMLSKYGYAWQIS